MAGSTQSYSTGQKAKKFNMLWKNKTKTGKKKVSAKRAGMEVSPQENGATISSTYKTVSSLGSAIITVQYYHAKDPNSINPNIHCSLANNILTQWPQTNSAQLMASMLSEMLIETGV